MTSYARCLAKPKELDTVSSNRNKDHTELAIELLNQTDLATTYGIIKQSVVSVSLYHLFQKSSHLSSSHLQMISLVQMYMSL